VTTIPCPCCGSPMAAGSMAVAALRHLRVPPLDRVVLRILADSYPEAVPIDRIVARAYAGTRDGGPVSSADIVKKAVSNLRRTLVPYGWTVPQSPRGHGVTGLYRLERLS
jgi:hypothetical protein